MKIQFSDRLVSCTECPAPALQGGKRCETHLVGELCVLGNCQEKEIYIPSSVLCRPHLTVFQQWSENRPTHTIQRWLIARQTKPEGLPAHLRVLGDNLRFEAMLGGVGVYYEYTLGSNPTVRHGHTVITNESAQLIRADREARGLPPPQVVGGWR